MMLYQIGSLKNSQIWENARPKCHFFGKLDIYVMKNRTIRYLWILKLKMKYMPFPRFRDLIMDFAHF